MPEEAGDQSRVFEGVLLALGATVLGGLIIGVTMTVALIAIGAVQLIYIIPLVLVLFNQRRKRAAMGAIIVAALVFLLNAACWGVVATVGVNLH